MKISKNIQKSRKINKKIKIVTTLIVVAFLLILLAIMGNVNKNNRNIEKQLIHQEKIKEIYAEYKIYKINGEEISATISFFSNVGNIEYVIAPNGNNIKAEDERSTLSIDYKLTNGVEYVFKLKIAGREEEDWVLRADASDKPLITMGTSEKYALIKKDAIYLQKTVDIDYGEKIEGYKNYYSIDNGDTWEEYTQQITINQKIDYVLAKTIKDSEEEKTIERIIKNKVEWELAEDALTKEAYDENKDTSMLVADGINGTKGQTENKYIKIDPEIEGFKIRVKLQGKGTIVTFLGSDKTTGLGNGIVIGNTDNNISENILTVPAGARYLMFSMNVTKNSYSNIYEIEIIPSIKATITKVGQTKISVKAETNKISEDTRKFRYMINSGVVLENSQNSEYTYEGLTDYTVYNIEIKAYDENGNEDTAYLSQRTDISNQSVIGFIARDDVDHSGKYQNTVAGTTYLYNVLYLNEDNINNYGSYDATTNTYTVGNITLGSAFESRMAVLKCDGNLTINGTITTNCYQTTNSSGDQVVQANVTKIKGMFIYCTGTLTNNGTITQTDRGTYDYTRENVYLWAQNNSYNGYTVPGLWNAEGGASVGSSKEGKKNGKPGENRY